MAGPVSARPLAIIVSCEHGGNAIPAPYRYLFADRSAQAALESHRGWDPGSLAIARRFARSLQAPLIASTTSRLLVELNRSPGHRRLFSEWSRLLPADERQLLLVKHYQPHREQVRAQITAAQSQGHDVLHLSIHTFTPIWDGVKRTTDIGLLFDPGRLREAALCRHWQQQLRRRLPQQTIHRNRPYRGTSDGLTTLLRAEWPTARYLGVELEVNQKYFVEPVTRPRGLLAHLVHSLQDVLALPLQRPSEAVRQM